MKSILHISLPRSGTTLLSERFTIIADLLNLKLVNYEDQLWFRQGMKVENVVFHKDGYIYSPLRRPYKSLDVSKFKCLFMLRDPRDNLVSRYYSIRYSHPVPTNVENTLGISPERFLKFREKASQQNINEFVQEISQEVVWQYHHVFKLMSQAPDHCFCTYEDMVLNTESWVADLKKFLGVPQDLEWITARDFQIESENVNSHKRKVLPGDYKEKLSPSVIEKLNRDFKEILTRMKAVWRVKYA